MTLEVYPAILPLPSQEGFEIEPGENIDRTVMAAGPARQREVFTQVPNGVSVRFKFTVWEYAVFDAWYKHRARRGAVYFTIPLLSGLGVIDHEARFKGQVKAVPRGAFFIVTASLEVREPPVLSEEALEIALTEDIPALILSINNCHTLVHGFLPDPNCWG